MLQTDLVLRRLDGMPAFPNCMISGSVGRGKKKLNCWMGVAINGAAVYATVGHVTYAIVTADLFPKLVELLRPLAELEAAKEAT